MDWKTISNSINRLKDLEIFLDDPSSSNNISKKELLDLSREKEKLNLKEKISKIKD